MNEPMAKAPNIYLTFEDSTTHLSALMKTPLLLWGFLLLGAGMLHAQGFTDDFESYPVNAFIAQSSPAWRTWSANGAGTSEDARVTDEQAFSGDKSLKLFSNTPAGGPMDIILPFGQMYNSGTFTLGLKMYVVTGTGAYLNFQANQTIGQVWASDFFFREDGQLEVTTGSVVQGTTTFAHDQWLDLLCVFDLTNNDWQVFLDGEKIAAFSNNNNRVASLNLYPYNPDGTSTYYVDDVYFEHAPFVQPDLDLSLFSVQSKTKTIAGSSQPLLITLRNLGVQTIESVDVTWTDGTNSYTDALQNLNLGTDQSYQFTHSEAFLAEQGLTQIAVTISNVNGDNDENDKNDKREFTVEAVVPAQHKMVVAEEGTGTWCGWCPRGTVWMDRMTHEYPEYFIPIAVHNVDPMAFATYNNGVGSFPGFTGYPGVIFERALVIDPQALETQLFGFVTVNPAAILVNGASYDEAAGEMTISVTADFLQNITGNWRLNVVITEDGVTGSGSGYNQANFYAGGSNGPMGGYENLPNPVPASMMVYDHVARAILGGFLGEAGSVPPSPEAGTTHVRQFTYAVPANVNTEKIHIISMLLQPNGRINNANTTTLAEAIANGLASSQEQPQVLRSLDIYPNPAGASTTVHLALEQMQPVRMEVINLLGQTVHQESFGSLLGEHWLNLNTAQWPNGVYTLRVHTGEQFRSSRLVIQH